MPELDRAASALAGPGAGHEAGSDRGSEVCLSKKSLFPFVLVFFFLTQRGVFCLLTGRNIFRQETERLFYHGFDNYIDYAFPEDELRPLTCGPLTRDRDHPEKIELNDVLGNYSLTLIDSLSTLGILASSEETGQKAWEYFEDGVQEFVALYGDGSPGPSGQGLKARGFDLDSKVQVFETVIRGLGGFHTFFSLVLFPCEHWADE
jgi:hypothetical protein